MQASRGCPYRCSFCEIPVFYEGSYRTRPIEDIVEEIKQVIAVTGFRRFQFIDDQITGKHKFAKELFRALEPLNIRFSCLWTINSNHDDDLLELAAKAGIFHVNIGVESISQDSLLSMNKIQNHAKHYKKLLKKLRDITASTIRSISCSGWKKTIRRSSTTRSSSCTRSRRPRRSSTPSRRARARRCAPSSRTKAA